MTHTISTRSGQVCAREPLPAPPGQGLLRVAILRCPSDTLLTAALQELCSQCERGHVTTEGLSGLCL